MYKINFKLLKKLILLLSLIITYVILINNLYAKVDETSIQNENFISSKLNPNDYFIKAYQKYIEKDYDKAIELFKMSIVENPNNFMAYFYLSNIYFEQNKINEAISTINILSHLKPTQKEINNIYLNKNIPINDNDLIRYKQSAKYNFKEGLKLLSDGKWNEGLALLQNAVNMDPNNDYYIVKIGEVFLDLKNNLKAKEYFNKAIQINPKNTIALKRIAKIYETENDIKNALTTYEQLYKLTNDKNYLYAIEKCNEKLKNEIQSFISDGVVIKRRGRNIFVNLGYNQGLKMEDVINKYFLVYRLRKSSEIKEPNTAKIIGYEKPVLVGELLVTRIEDNFCETLIVSEQNGGIMIGDEVKCKN